MYAHKGQGSYKIPFGQKTRLLFAHQPDVLQKQCPFQAPAIPVTELHATQGALSTAKGSQHEKPTTVTAKPENFPVAPKP